ncbi:MAG: hypothetical protein AAGJ82_04605, partial [Bacteroidota bacterium]
MLKQLLSLALLVSTLSMPLFGQVNPMNASTNTDNKVDLAEAQEEVSEDDYERLLDAYVRVKFREFAYENLALTREEIIAVDPLYMEYMREKNELNDQRSTLMESYREDIKTADDKA